MKVLQAKEYFGLSDEERSSLTAQVVFTDGEMWYKDGQVHREFGPADIWYDKRHSDDVFFLNGVQYRSVRLYWQEMLKLHPDQEELILSHILCDK